MSLRLVEVEPEPAEIPGSSPFEGERDEEAARLAEEVFEAPYPELSGKP